MLSSKFLGLNATGRVPLVLSRPSQTGGGYVNGTWVESESDPITIAANVQPVGYKETMIVAEADRSKKMLKVYSPDVIYSEEENVNGPDEFEWEGDTFRVMKVLNYSMGILNHFKAIAVMKERINYVEPV
jgi:hypothetical protein